MPLDDASAARDADQRRQAADAEVPPRDGEQQQDRTADPPPRRSPTVWFVLAALALAAIGGGTAYWYATRNEVSTDDAYTDGNAITIAPKIAGNVTELNVTDNQLVRTGDVLLRIDPRDYLAARDLAAARVTSTEAQAGQCAAGAGDRPHRRSGPAGTRRGRSAMRPGRC